jgi:iron-sulfur cluster repair protein YtfE (RIC family)
MDSDENGMDAIALLIDQHRHLEERFDAALSTLEEADSTSRAASVASLGDHLTVHIASEEEVFYPAVREQGIEDILLESLEEHLSLKRLLADLIAMDPSEVTFEAKLKVLAEQALHHHKEEEEHLFPRVREGMSAAALAHLGERMCERQLALRREGAPRERVADQTGRAAPL